MQFCTQFPKLLRITIVQYFALIQFGMTLARSVGTNSSNPADPVRFVNQGVPEVVEMGTIQHVVQRLFIRLKVDLVYRILKCVAVGQATVSFGRKANNNRQADLLCSACDPDCLGNVVHSRC